MVDALEPSQAQELILGAARERRALAVSALATHGVMTGVDDPSHQYRLNSLDLVVPDGQPVRWMLNSIHGLSLKERVYGPDLMLSLCDSASREGLSVFLFGSTVEVLQQLERRLQERFPRLKIAGKRPSRFRTLSEDEARELASEIEESQANLVFVGLGCPRQEVWVYENRNRISAPLLAVGAAFDFNADLKPQAPSYLQRLGLEWFFRFCCEPKRLFQRTVFLYPRFLFYALLNGLQLRSFSPNEAVAPAVETNFG